MKLLRPLCLASASPRRRELLRGYGLEFVVRAPKVDERAQPGEAPAALATRLAALKAEAVRPTFPRHVILAADTVVVHRAAPLGKPADAADAARMLHLLSGTTHQVVTGYRLLDAATGAHSTRAVETQVTFRRLPPDWIQWYSRLDESRDKAGAYAIQGLGGAMVERLEGSYPNVVGLPIEAVFWDLLAQGWLAL